MYPVVGFLCENCGLILGGRIHEQGQKTLVMIWDALISGKVLVTCPHCGHENVLKEIEGDDREVN